MGDLLQGVLVAKVLKTSNTSRAVIAKTRLLSVTSGPSVGRGLLQENNDFLVGVVLLRQITHADQQMSRILIFGHMILLGCS